MRLLMIADTYVPARISGALQLRDLAIEMVAQGHRVTVLAPTAEIEAPWQIEELDGVRVLRVRALRSKDVGYLRRTLAEILMPFVFLRALDLSGLSTETWEGVIWYSPTIFLGRVAMKLKQRSGCKGYLILRDLFPDWAVDAGIMRKGIPYHFFKWVERYQYKVADIIGVQTPGNITLVSRNAPPGKRIEVLHNWLSDRVSNEVAEAPAPDLGALEGRTIFVYAGNMGVAQDIDAFLNLAADMLERTDVGFLFVGRGSEVSRLQAAAVSLALNNVQFMGEIDSASIPALLRKCHVGIVALDPRHTTHNIPGKFIAYLTNGVPVLARVNQGNDLVAIVEKSGVGFVIEGDSPAQLRQAANRLVDEPALRISMALAGRELASSYFTPASAVGQIVAALAEEDIGRAHDALGNP